jgi:hypothetical protein
MAFPGYQIADSQDYAVRALVPQQPLAQLPFGGQRPKMVGITAEMHDLDSIWIDPCFSDEISRKVADSEYPIGCLQCESRLPPIGLERIQYFIPIRPHNKREFKPPA